MYYKVLYVSGSVRHPSSKQPVNKNIQENAKIFFRNFNGKFLEISWNFSIKITLDWPLVSCLRLDPPNSHQQHEIPMTYNKFTEENFQLHSQETEEENTRKINRVFSN